jgi:hypothetical protein
VPTKPLLLASIAATASTTTSGLERPMEEPCISSLIPERYKLLAKFVPEIARQKPGKIRAGAIQIAHTALSYYLQITSREQIPMTLLLAVFFTRSLP